MAFPPAPRSRSASLTSIDSEIVPQILRFLRDILSVYQVNLMHPSSIRMALLMQDFLGVKDYLVQIRARERQVQNKHTKYVQVYIHHVMHISSIRSIVRSFVEEFMASKVKDVSVAWTEESASNVINNLKQFMDNMQSFLITAFKKDCAEMVADLCEKGEQLYGKGRDIAQAVANMTFTDLSNVSSKRVEEVRESMLQELEEEMESITRAAVRRQVELDVYIPCMGRASFIMQKTLAAKDTKLFEKMKVLLPQPQSYYDIPLQHISPCSWFPIVTAFQDIKNIVLPCDKVQHLLQLSTAIPTLFRAEHPLSEQTLGADDLFPIFIYIVVQSKLPALWTLSQEMQQLCDPDHAFSEAGYYLATLQAALQHLLDVNLKLDRPFDQSHKR
ncbi:hypothetical protein EON65_10435 [archaeon]|nr:MAG: hypothetical protein EON65_10435 [archaeon]